MVPRTHPEVDESAVDVGSQVISEKVPLPGKRSSSTGNSGALSGLFTSVLLGLILAIVLYSAVIGSISFFGRHSSQALESAPSTSALNEFGAATVPTQEPLPRVASSDLSAWAIDLSASQTDIFPTWKSWSTYNNTVTVNIIWYGNWTAAQKGAVKTFIESLEQDVDPAKYGFPQGTTSVNQWWDQVHEAMAQWPVPSGPDGTWAPKAPPAMKIALGNETDAGFSLGEGILPRKDIPRIVSSVVGTNETLQRLIKEKEAENTDNAATSTNNEIFVVAVGSGIVMQGLCTDNDMYWSGTGSVTLSEEYWLSADYIYVTNPNQGELCPGTQGRLAAAVGDKAATGDIGVDSVIDMLGGKLASVITNFDHEGYASPKLCAAAYIPTEIDSSYGCDMYTLCKNHYNPVQPAPTSGQSYNVVGKDGATFVLSKLWSPRTSHGDLPHCAMSMTDASKPDGEFASLGWDFGAVAEEVLPRSKLLLLRKFVSTTTLRDPTPIQDPVTSGALSGLKAFMLPPDMPINLKTTEADIPKGWSKSFPTEKDFSAAITAYWLEGLFRALLSTGEEYTVFLPQTSAWEGGSSSIVELTHIVKGKLAAADLQKGVSMTSLFQGEQFKAFPSQSSIAIINIKKPTAITTVTKPNILCIDRLCLHGVDSCIGGQPPEEYPAEVADLHRRPGQYPVAGSPPDGGSETVSDDSPILASNAVP